MSKRTTIPRTELMVHDDAVEAVVAELRADGMGSWSSIKAHCLASRGFAEFVYAAARMFPLNGEKRGTVGGMSAIQRDTGPTELGRGGQSAQVASSFVPIKGLRHVTRARSETESTNRRFVPDSALLASFIAG